MKKQFILSATLLIFLSALSFGVNPNKTDDASAKMVSKLHADVNLAPEQQRVIKLKAAKYQTSLAKARLMSNQEEARLLMQHEKIQYEASLDSILTPDQKRIKTEKMEQRKIKK